MARKPQSDFEATSTSVPKTKREGRSPSIKEVAKLAQVGLGTVSRVINGGENVSNRTLSKVLAAIAELGYFPDTVAQSMRNNRTMTFACVVRDFTVPVLSLFVDAMQKTIDPAGFSLIVASSYHDLDRELSLIQRLQQRRIDGLVITTSSETSLPLLKLLESVNFPVVLMDREAPLGLDAVIVDHATGTKLAIDQLIAMGHKRIAFISGAQDLHPTKSRLKAYEDALRAAKIRKVPELIRTGSFGADAGYQQARELLALPVPPTALMAGGSAYLPGLIRAARERGLRIPQDLSIVVGAESDMAMLMEPAIATVRWDHDKLGQAAGRLLMERLADPGCEPIRLVFESEFVPGGSCAPPATD